MTNKMKTGREINHSDFVSISAKDYVELFVADADEKSAYAQIKEASQILFKRDFTVRDMDPETGFDRVTKCRWLSTFSYIDGDNAVKLMFTPIIALHLKRLEAEFTRLHPSFQPSDKDEYH